MNKKELNQEKNYKELNQYLANFEAKIKDGEKYINSSSKLTIINKFNIERTIEPYVIKRLKSNNQYWNFDGITNDKQKKLFIKLKNNSYIDNLSFLTVINKHNEEIKLTSKSIKSLANKYKIWLTT